jgi:SdiA-regulated
MSTGPKASFTLHLARERVLPVRGASAVAALSGGLLVADDDRGIYRISRSGASLWAGPDLHPALGDLEGLAVDDRQTLVWALAEERGTVIALPLGRRAPRPTVIGRLPRPGTRAKKNKGFEGLAFLPRRFSPSSRASLIAVHEAKPKRVGIFALPNLHQTDDLELPKAAKKLLDDLADVTVDPVTGAFLLLSDESQRIVVLRLVDDALELASAHDLPLGRGEKAEGLDFATPSRLLVVSDATGKLFEIAVRRSG